MKPLSVCSIAIASIFLVGLISCSKDETSLSPGGPDSPPGEPTQATDVPIEPVKTYDIQLEPVQGFSCPDLENFFSQLRNLPDDAWLRKVTTAMATEKKNDDGSAPRSNFLKMLSFSSFDIREVRSADFALEEPIVKQTSCEDVSFNYPDGIHRDFVIKESTATLVKLSLKPDPAALSPEIQDVTFEWLNPRLLMISSQYQAMDFCPNYKRVPVTRTEILRWGPPEMLQSTTTEKIDSIFVEDMTQALYNLPEDLRHLERASNEVEGNLIEIPVSDLKRIKMTAVRRDLQICPYRSKPPNGDEPPPPDPEATPDPTTAPDTGVDPTGSADTGPAATPTPSPTPAAPVSGVPTAP